MAIIALWSRSVQASRRDGRSIGSRLGLSALGLGAIVLLASLSVRDPCQADEPRRPNILFAIADDWSHGHASAYGCPWIRTPGFDRVAREGLLFNNAYTPNAKCAPSRACILTGRNSWQLEAACNHICYFPEKFKTYAEGLAEHRYFVGTTAKGWGPGVATDSRGSPRAMAGRLFNGRHAKPLADGMSNNDYAANFNDFLDAAPDGQPWCFWYGALEPHRAYEFGSGVKKANKSPSDIKQIPRYWPDNETTRNDLLDYALEVEHFDNHLARMLAILEERGQLQNTLVVATSDHGMPFPRSKGQAYDESNHVPLAIMWPSGIRDPGRSIDEFVSFVDLAPTFLEAAGLDGEQVGMKPMTGTSLFDLFAPNPARKAVVRDHVLIGKERHDIGRPNDQGYPIRGIVKGQWLFIRNYETSRWPACDPRTGYLNCDGSPTKTEVLMARRNGTDATYWELCFGKRVAEELYDIRRDPDCMENLASSAEFQTIKSELERRMIAELTAQDDPRMAGQGHLFEQYPYADERTRGFYERFLRGEKVNAGWVNRTDFEPPPSP